MATCPMASGVFSPASSPSILLKRRPSEKLLYRPNTRPRRRASDLLPYDPNRPPPPKMPRMAPPKLGTIAAVVSEFEHCGPGASADRATAWAKEFLAPDQVRAWLAVGLRTDDLGMIIDFRTRGVPPEAITWSINKETILDRIRIRGYSSQAVVRTLRKAGMLQGRSA